MDGSAVFQPSAREPSGIARYGRKGSLQGSGCCSGGGQARLSRPGQGSPGRAAGALGLRAVRARRRPSGPRRATRREARSPSSYRAHVLGSIGIRTATLPVSTTSAPVQPRSGRWAAKEVRSGQVPASYRLSAHTSRRPARGTGYGRYCRRIRGRGRMDAQACTPATSPACTLACCPGRKCARALPPPDRFRQVRGVRTTSAPASPCREGGPGSR